MIGKLRLSHPVCSPCTEAKTPFAKSARLGASVATWEEPPISSANGNRSTRSHEEVMEPPGGGNPVALMHVDGCCTIGLPLPGIDELQNSVTLGDKVPA